MRKIFETVVGDDWGDVEISSIDMDDYIIRFKNLALDRYNSDSYNSYKARASRALNWYKNFLSNPGWVPPIRKSPSTAVNKKETTGRQKETRAEVSNIKYSNDQQELVSFPFPMSDGSMASLYLPKHITIDDAERLSDFVRTLVIKRKTKDDE